MKEQHFIDKSAWSHGPWQREPDRIEWRAHGLPCLIVRGGHGALCGYVGVPEGHQHFGANGFAGEPHDLRVHGGITYGSPCQDGGHICHVAQPGEPEHVYWLGFDCAHGFDYMPSDECGWPYRYKTVDYVKGQVEQLAEQLAESVRS